jgi:hypothetical protein
MVYDPRAGTVLLFGGRSGLVNMWFSTTYRLR